MPENIGDPIDIHAEASSISETKALDALKNETVRLTKNAEDAIHRKAVGFFETLERVEASLISLHEKVDKICKRFL